MNKLLFVTGNKRKIWEAEQILHPLGIEFETQDLDIVEIQHHDPALIAEEKAKSAYRKTHKELVICDHSWNFPALNGFPGGYMKDMNHWLAPEDFIALVRGKEDKRAIVAEEIVYTDGKNIRHFSTEVVGNIIDAPRGIGNVACERVVIFEGSTKTIAEHVDAGEHAREVSDSAWVKFADWYQGRENDRS